MMSSAMNFDELCDPERRTAALLERKRLKMASSAHAYVRGSTERFYEWLAGESARRLPEGPPIWICGDCHIGNLGPVADSHGDVAVQLRDFDQSVIGNPAHDLLRLGLSLAMLARGSSLPGVATAVMAAEMVRGYERALEKPLPVSKAPAPIRHTLRDAKHRSFRALLVEHVRNTKPTIPLGRRFWPLTNEERTAVEQLFLREDVRKLITTLACRDDDAAVKVADAAYWVKGCSSLGRLRIAVLVRVKGGSVGKGNLCLMDLKEAVAASAPHDRDAFMPANPAERVVRAARRLSPYLGQRMLPVSLLGRSVFMRELLPQDLKIDIERLGAAEAGQVANCLGSILGRAHGRVLDDAAREEWRACIGFQRTGPGEVPPWLWSSIVDLVSHHEAAYLDHCRRFALERSGLPADRAPARMEAAAE
jgi:uncharacterized protein (DUF2252 family)